MGKNEVEIIVTAEDKASGVLKGVGGALSGISRVAGAAALGGIAAVGVGLGIAGRAAIEMNSSLETSEMQFTTLMGDADKAAEHVASLFEFGAKTPFETGPIITASKHFQVFGGDVLNSMDNLTLFGDSAAAVGAPIDEVAFWVGRAYSAIQNGQPFGESAARLQEMGLMTGETRLELESLNEEGATADEVWSHFSGSFEKFEGAMEDQANSWVGLTSTIKDNLQLLAAQALKPFFDLAKEGMAGLIAWINDPRVQAGIRNITEGLTAVIKAVVSFINNLREGMSPMDSFIEAIWDLVPQPVLDALVNFRDNILPGLMTAFHNIVDPIVAWVQNNVQLKDVLIVLAGVVGGVVLGAIWSVITAMAPLLLVFGAAIAIVALLRNAWENNWGGIQEKTAAVLGFIQGIIQSAFAAIQAFWAAHGADIMAKAAEIWQTIQTAISTVITTVQTIITTAFAAIQAFWQAHGADIMAKAAEIWQTIQTAISTVITTVQTIITTAFAAIQAFWQAHGAAILATATQFWNLIKGLIDGVVNQIKLIVDAFRLAFEGDWYAFGQKLFEIWENAWNTVVNFLSGLWDMVLPWLSSLWNSVKGWFTGTDWASLGRSIVQGIINGLRAMGGALSSALQGIVDAAIQRIKAMLGIASPSKVTTHYGKMIGQGLIDGMLSKVGAVGDAAGQMFGAAGRGGVSVGFVGGSATGGGGRTTVVNIDARGAARGVDRDLRAMVEDVLRQYGTQADMRVRTS